jgi:hypothetical protein
MLPGAGIQPLGFDWSATTGVEVPTTDGWRVRFDAGHGDGDLTAQIATLQTVRSHLAQAGVSPQVIDVRFGDRPYWQ